MNEDKKEDNNLSDDYGKYNPSKKEREIRRRVYQRWLEVRDDPQRKQAEKDWDEAQKQYRMYVPEIDPDDWRSHLELPDAFSAIQVHMQETVERYSRPLLVNVEETDRGKESFWNSIMNWNMNRTDFDIEYYKAKLYAAITGTAFLKTYYRVEKREVMDPTSVGEDGEIKYTKKIKVDHDDNYTEWISNEWVFIDPGAVSIDKAIDCFEREILPIEAFHEKYENLPGFRNVELVKAGGDVGRTTFFQTPTDLMADEVEILHYKNRNRDCDEVVANNIVISYGPLRTKHKELPYSVVYHYRVPGRFWGLGVPKVVFYLSEERKAIRRLNLDRQKIQISGFWLHNSAFDLDDEETEARPGGFLSVETNGQPLANVIQKVDMGDVSTSYFRTEEILLEDIRRAHGIDDRIQGVQSGGTATEAAILKESALKRVNMIAILAEKDTMKRVGRLAWSNIRFFYKAGRYKDIYLPSDKKPRVQSRPIVLDGVSFNLEKDPATQKMSLLASEAEGRRIFTVDKNTIGYLDGDFDVQMDGAAFTPWSKAIKQAKTTEMITTIASTSELMAEADPHKILKRYAEINDEDPKNWMKNSKDAETLLEMADLENAVMKEGQPLKGTEGADENHTLEHIRYTESAEFATLSPVIQEIFRNHILEEHDNNPKTGSSAELLAPFDVDGDGIPDDPAMAGSQATVEGAPAPSIQPNVAGQVQMADMQPANMNQ